MFKMETKLLFVLLVNICCCTGHLLSDIVTGAINAHKQVHTAAHNVANTVIGGLSQGLNVNFDAHVGVDNPGYGHKPASIPNIAVRPDSVETIVVVEENPNQNSNQPNEYVSTHQHKHEIPYYGRPPSNYGYPPPNYGHSASNHRYPPQNNGHSSSHYGHEHHNYNYNKFPPRPSPYPTGNGHHETDYNRPGSPNHYDHNGNITTTMEVGTDQNNNEKPDRGELDAPNRGEHNNKQQQNQPNYGSTHNPAIENSNKPIIKDEKTTKKPDDEPFFVPLKPNEYTYGGDKINVTAPKRETNENPKPAEEKEDEFDIDIRFKDQ